MKRILKIIGIVWLLLTIISVIVIKRDTYKIYGGLTEKVDHTRWTPSPEDYRIVNAKILSPQGDRFIEGQTLVVRDGVIAAIDSSTQHTDSKSYDAQGKYLIPGLIDSHVHLWYSENDLLLYIANGVTQIREMIGETHHLQWKEEIANGRLGPDMYVTSPRLGSFGTMEGWFMRFTQKFNNVRTAAEAQTYVRSMAEKGYDGIKIYSHLNKESYDAISEEIIQHDLDMVGHIPWSTSWDDVYASNQNEIAHIEEVMNAFRREYDTMEDSDKESFLQYVTERSEAISERLIAENISVTTTVWLTQSFIEQQRDIQQVLRDVELAYVNPGISEWNPFIPGGLGWLPEVNRYKIPDDLSPEQREGRLAYFDEYAKAAGIILGILSQNGVNILAGTDANLPAAVPGFSLHDELIAMQSSGMSPAEVLAAATIRPAQWLAINAGQIAHGKRANMVLLDANPLIDISNTKMINTVFSNQKVLERDQLDDILHAVKSANDNSRKKDITDFN